MKCARYLDGAHRPAPLTSAESPRRPDPLHLFTVQEEEQGAGSYAMLLFCL